MINWIHSRVFRPEHGWDPVPAAYGAEYAEAAWRVGIEARVIETLRDWLGGFAGKTVLDLGGGAGQYAIAFAREGASVTWHDVSEKYRQFAKRKATEAGVGVEFSLGYMDEARNLLGRQFDLVFNRVCWNYGRGDASFAGVIYSIVKPGGVGYVDTNHSLFRLEALPLHARLRVHLNSLTGWKIGHAFPPRGRVARELQRFPIQKILVDYSGPFSDRIVFRKRG